jgi:hypothetical protein
MSSAVIMCFDRAEVRYLDNGVERGGVRLNGDELLPLLDDEVMLSTLDECCEPGAYNSVNECCSVGLVTVGGVG